MSAEIETKNLSSMNNICSLSPVISSICSPLFSNFSISHFSHMRIFQDGSRSFFCPNEKWIKLYVSNQFQDDTKHAKHRPRKNGIYQALWSGFERDNVFSALYSLNIWNGFTIFDRHSTYLDCFHFATSKENQQISSFYLNNLNLLDRFILYYKDKSASFLNVSHQDYLIRTKNNIAYEFSDGTSVDAEEMRRSDFIEKTKIKKLSIDHNGRSFELSEREAECMYHVCSGKTVKEVASYLNLSPRTVESYIDKAREKLGCTSKSQLVQIISENLLISSYYSHQNSR